MILTRDFAVSQVYSCVFKQWKTVGFFCCKRVCPQGGNGVSTRWNGYGIGRISSGHDRHFKRTSQG
jgi:hypothetical protein